MLPAEERCRLELGSSPSHWGREVESAFRGIAPPPSTPAPSSPFSRATSSLGSASVWGSEFTLGSSSSSEAPNDLPADEAVEPSRWRGLIAVTIWFVGRLLGRALGPLRAPWGPPRAPSSPFASDGDSTLSLSEIASSGSSTAVEESDPELERMNRRLGELHSEAEDGEGRASERK